MTYALRFGAVMGEVIPSPVGSDASNAINPNRQTLPVQNTGQQHNADKPRALTLV